MMGVPEMGSVITSRVYPEPGYQVLRGDGPIDMTMPHLVLKPLGRPEYEEERSLSLRVGGQRRHGNDPKEITLAIGDVVALRDALNEWLHPEALDIRTKNL